MFRHSEIQRLLSDRRRQDEQQNEHVSEAAQTAQTVSTHQPTRKSKPFAGDAVPSRRTIRTYDEPPLEDEVGALDYDEPATSVNGKQDKKSFIWPKLG